MKTPIHGRNLSVFLSDACNFTRLSVRRLERGATKWDARTEAFLDSTEVPLEMAQNRLSKSRFNLESKTEDTVTEDADHSAYPLADELLFDPNEVPISDDMIDEWIVNGPMPRREDGVEIAEVVEEADRFREQGKEDEANFAERGMDHLDLCLARAFNARVNERWALKEKSSRHAHIFEIHQAAATAYRADHQTDGKGVHRGDPELCQWVDQGKITEDIADQIADMREKTKHIEREGPAIGD